MTYPGSSIVTDGQQSDGGPLEADVLVDAQVVDGQAIDGPIVGGADAPAPPPSDAARPPRGPLAVLDSAWEWVFGGVSLIVGLAVLATLPILQFLSLGYLLETSGRIVRTGRLRSGFVGMRKAARVGSLVLGAWLLLWAPRFISSLLHDALRIDPASPAAGGLRIALVVVTGWVVLHTMAAWRRGGKLRHFLWPRPILFLRQIFERGAYARARDAVWDFVVGLRLPYYFWLGLRGFVGGLVWLIVPVTLLAAGREVPLLGLVGGLLLGLVVLYLPFLQARMAAENRFRAMFELRPLRDAYRRAPLAFAVSLLITLALALPLYLLKVETIPRQVTWLPSLLFVVSIFPARLLCGWALARAGYRAEPRHWLMRIVGRLGLVPVAAAYVLIVYFTQYLSWHGVASLYEQHAFLVPVPFLGG